MFIKKPVINKSESFLSFSNAPYVLYGTNDQMVK